METLASSYLPPPTYADVVLVDERTRRSQFNPLWLDWFLRLAAFTSPPGGAVTQTGGRTTAVTIDKTCGQITLASEAGQAAWQTFTVNNSTVAATYVIVVNVASSTNDYAVRVSAVAAGSFNLAVSAVSGTATDTPVLNFAVMKAVTA